MKITSQKNLANFCSIILNSLLSYDESDPHFKISANIEANQSEVKKFPQNCELVNYVSKYLRSYIKSSQKKLETYDSSYKNPSYFAIHNSIDDGNNRNNEPETEEKVKIDQNSVLISSMNIAVSPSLMSSYEDIIKEFISTEEIYYNNLDIIIVKYRDPVFRSLQSNRAMTTWQNAKLLFDDITAVYNISKFVYLF